MGCINSTKRMTEMRGVTDAAGSMGANANVNGGAANEAAHVFRVRAVRLQPDIPSSRNGFLELTPREIIFEPQGGSGHNAAAVVWSLQHLRRYGVNGETFSFEAGRRCMTGPGIFTFRLSEAEPLYQLFQRYINDVSTLTDDMFQLHGNATIAANEHPSFTLGRAHAHTNNYLEPTNAQRTAAARSDYFGSNSPVSLNLDSPDSLRSLSFSANEVVHFTNNSRYTPQIQAAAAGQLTQQTGGNIYSERPFAQFCEHNNNNSSSQNNNRSESSIYGDSGTVSAFSTISRKLSVRRSSMDIPPKECAPLLLTPTTPLRLYANIEQWSDMQTPDCFYENLQHCDLPLLLPPSTPVASTSNMTGSNPTTPGGVTTITRMASIADPESMSLGSGGETSTQAASLVNYIVLDLDQPRSPATVGSQYSPKTPFGSAFSISAATTDMDETSLPLNATTPTHTNNNSNASAASMCLSSISTATNTSATTTTTNTTTITNINMTESLHEQLDYSTIDFVKTCALIKSSANGIDFDTDPDPDMAEEELRITRHSKCVRKAYSISE